MIQLTTLRLGAVIVLFAASLLAQGTDGSKPAAPPGNADSKDVETRVDLQYSDVARDHKRNMLDVYRPAGAANPPLVMFVHGGGWTGGSKDRHQALGQALARQGIACATINTQLRPFAQPAEMAADAARAFAWLHGHAGELGYDSKNMYLMGHSSGAHLVSWLALDAELQTRCKVPFGAVRGVIALSGIYDVRHRHPVLDGVFGKDLDVRTQASPIVHVREGAPPFLMVWAEHDMPGVAFSSRMLEHRLRATGGLVEDCELPGTDHVQYIRFGQGEDPITPKVAAFIKARAADAGKPARGAGPQQVKQTANVLAANGPRVDLWQPQAGKAGALLVLAAVDGEEAGAARLAEVLAAGGAAVAVVRCGPAAQIRYPEGMRAVAGAASALLERTAALGLPDALFFGGCGAGGWLAAGAGMQVELPGRRTRGVMLLGVPGTGAVGEMLPGLAAPEGSELSPSQWLRKGCPKLLAMWGDGDTPALLRDHRVFGDAARMLEPDSPVTAIEFAGRSTAACVAQLGATGDQISEAVLVFLGL